MPDVEIETTGQTAPNQSTPAGTPPSTSPPAAEKPKSPKSSKTKLVIIIISACVALVLVGILGYFIGKGSNNTPPSKENTATKSSSVSNANSEISATLSSIKLDPGFETSKADYLKYWNSTTPSARPSKPEFLSQNKLLLTVAFTNNNDSAPASITPGALRLKDTNDKQYQPEFQPDLKEGYTVSLNPSETTKMDVYFTVPSSQTHFKLIYQNVTVDVTSP